MKTTIQSLIILASFAAPLAMAGERVEVKVKGMVCSFCAQGIKKKFSGNEAVSKIEVNLDDKWVRLDLGDGKKLGDEDIKKSIKDSGYDVVSIERSPIK